MRGISHRNYATRGKSRLKLSHARTLKFTNSCPNTIDFFFFPSQAFCVLFFFALPSVISSARFPRARCHCPQLASSASSDSGPEPCQIWLQPFRWIRFELSSAVQLLLHWPVTRRVAVLSDTDGWWLVKGDSTFVARLSPLQKPFLLVDNSNPLICQNWFLYLRDCTMALNCAADKTISWVDVVVLCVTFASAETNPCRIGNLPFLLFLHLSLFFFFF